MDNKLLKAKKAAEKARKALDSAEATKKEIFPKGSEVFFHRGNMIEAAPATVLWANIDFGWGRLRVKNQYTDKERNIALSDVIEII